MISVCTKPDSVLGALSSSGPLALHDTETEPFSVYLTIKPEECKPRHRGHSAEVMIIGLPALAIKLATTVRIFF